jgi:hypothetical protein
MPKIPQHQSEGGIRVSGTPEMGLGAVSASKQAQEEGIVKAIETAEDTLVRVRDFRQQSEAQAYAFEKLNSIKALADQDTDFDAAKYETEIDKVGMEATRTISGRLAKDEFMAQFQRQATALKWGIKNDFRAKELQAADATIEYQGQQIIDTYGGMDDAMKMSSVANYKTQLENAVKVGLYNKGTADLKWAEFQKKVFRGQVKWDIYNDKATQEENSEVLRELRKKKDSIYDYLTTSERIDLIQESQRRIFQNNQSFKRELELSKDTRFNSIFDKINTDTLTLQDIDNEMVIPEERGGIPKKQLLDIKDGIQMKIKSDLDLIGKNNEKARDYLKFINNFIDDENDRQKAREYLAKAYGDMILSPQEASYLNKIKRETEDIEFNRTSMWLKSAVKAIRETFRGRKTSTDSEAALAIKQLISGMNKGRNPNELVKEILYQSAIKKNPILLNIPENGNLSMDADGNIKIIMPDLTTKETKEGK